MVIVDIESELASIFAMTGTPGFVQSFLLRQQPPIDTADLFANIASSSEEMHTLVTTPAGYGDDETLAPEARLRCRGGAVGSAWRLCEASFKNKKIPPPNTTEKPSLIDTPIDLDRMTRMLSRFRDVYGFAIPVSDWPSDRTLSHWRIIFGWNSLYGIRPFERGDRLQRPGLVLAFGTEKDCRR